MKKTSDFLIVGAGFSGCTMAERLADAGHDVLIIDQRPHLGGNAFDEDDRHGVRVHRYGPHIFHTNAKSVVDYLSRFTAWRPYQHRVRAMHRDRLFPIPINLDTINAFFGKQLDEQSAPGFLDSVREPRNPLATSEDVVVNAVGRDLYNAFFRGYTRKQWGLDPSEIDAQVTARIPVRTNRDDRYFTDAFQQMPAGGYDAMFKAMVDHPLIRVELNTPYDPARHRRAARTLIFTGPIDRFYDFSLGRLAYRSIAFEHEHLASLDRAQEVGTVNYPDENVPFTRITEFKHLTGQACSGTSIVKEFPRAEGDPYYPIPSPKTRALYKRYQELAESETDVVFLGRLAQYRYYNMDQVVAAALVKAEQIVGRR